MRLSFLSDLYRRRGGIKLGLGRIAAAFPLVKRREIPVYHVAGTNGKGTAVLAIDLLLRARDLKTGCFVSPHIVDFNERMLVGGSRIPDAAVERLYRELERTIPDFGALSFFEVTFLLAWRWWEEEAVERAVVEVGLGGRLDATSVIGWPKTDLIASIGLDHTQVLGETSEEIAAEKLGIVHPGDRLVLGATIAPGLAAWMRDHAAAQGAAPVLTAPPTPPEPFVPPRGVPLSPEQTANLAAAHAAVAAAEGTTPAADFSGLRLPGRFQRFRERVILDVAHNPPAMRALAEHLRALGMRPDLLFGAMKDKDIGGMLAAIAPAVGDIFPVCLEADAGRGATVPKIFGRTTPDIRRRMKPRENDDETIAAALGTLRDGPEPLLVAGSFFMLERFLTFLATPRGEALAADLHLPPEDLE